MSGERPAYPTDDDVAKAREEQLLLSLDGPMPGRVQSYDPATQTADIVPLVRKQVARPDGEYTFEALPVLPSVPVLFPRAGDWFMSLPIAEGTYGLVIVCAPAIGHWRVGNGDVTDPGDLRRHHMAHAVFMPCGMVPRSEALERTGTAGTVDDSPTGAPTGMVIGSDAADGSRILLRANGTVEIVAGGAVSIRSSVSTRVDFQGGTQPFVNGTLYADALGVFLTALGVFVAGTGTIITALGVFCAAVGAHPMLTAALAGPATTLATAITAFGGVVSTFGTAITNFSGGRAAYLSTRIRGE